MFATHLSCWACAQSHPLTKLINLCRCGGPLRVEYDWPQLRRRVKRDDGQVRANGLWRWGALLPLPPGVKPVTLGEGGTLLLRNDRLAKSCGVRELYIKDEGLNPTGSFKARGMSVAVSMAQHLGATKLAVPSAGNAGGALAAYAAAAGLEAHIFMPRDVPAANRLECELAGARVTLVDGLISDCGKMVAERASRESWFDVSTLKEPYRVEGKKTLGYEIAEQLGWTLPDVIVYPTGGGTGLIGMAKAFDELVALGWLESDRQPRFVAVQAAGCAPVTRAFEQGESRCTFYPNAQTRAAGLRVPKPLADFVILDILRRCNGTSIAISDEAMLSAARELSAATGVCACPEGGACLAAARQLAVSGWIRPDERVVIFNTGSGLKYAEVFAGRA
jgi:threonine synthase